MKGAMPFLAPASRQLPSKLSCSVQYPPPLGPVVTLGLFISAILGPAFVCGPTSPVLRPRLRSSSMTRPRLRSYGPTDSRTEHSEGREEGGRARFKFPHRPPCASTTESWRCPECGLGSPCERVLHASTYILRIPATIYACLS